MLEALCRQSSTTLDIVHAEDGPPITQRTSGLGRDQWTALIYYPSTTNESKNAALVRVAVLEKRLRQLCVGGLTIG
jgi:hypothetical protein